MRVSTAAAALAVPVCGLPLRSPLRRRRLSPCFGFKDVVPAHSSVDVASAREGSSSVVEAVPLREGADQAAGRRSEVRSLRTSSGHSMIFYRTSVR